MKLAPLTLARENGIALPAAVAVLALLGMMATTVFALANQVDSSSTRDRSSKRAFQAAEAGLEVAVERLNRLRPGNGQCLADAPQPPDVTGECPASTPQDLGNGASFTYRVTPVLPAGDACRVLASPSPPPNGQSVRCVTSIGEVHGIRRRVQARVLAQPLFPIDGVFGLDRIAQVNASRIYGDLTRTVFGDLGTNGTASRATQTNKQRYVWLGGPDASASGFNPTQIKQQPEAFVLPMVPFEPAETSNDNSKLAGLDNSIWNRNTRELTVGNANVVVLESGTYSFCRLRLSQSGRLFVKPGHSVQIYIDSPDRDASSDEPSSSCASTGGAAGLASGTMSFENSSFIGACSVLSGSICTPGRASDLLIFAYGRRAVNPDISIDNGGQRVAGIYAPRSRVRLANDAEIQGGLVAAEIDISNAMDFLFDPSLRDVSGGEYQRRWWTECRSKAPNAADPESGC